MKTSQTQFALQENTNKNQALYIGNDTKEAKDTRGKFKLISRK